MSSKLKTILLIGLFFSIATPALALTYYQQTQGLVPGVTNTYFIGTSTPALKEYKGIFVRDLTVSGTCTGCGGGSAFAYPFPSNATTTALAFNGGATFAGATTTALAVTGSSTISSILNVGGAINANGGVVGALTGNASTATALQTGRTINGVSFNGTADITITAASSTLLANTNTWSGANTFNNGLTANIFTVGTSASIASTTLTGNTLLTNATTSTFAVTSLTSGRVPYISTGGTLIDSSEFTFAPNLLTLGGTNSGQLRLENGDTGTGVLLQTTGSPGSATITFPMSTGTVCLTNTCVSSNIAGAGISVSGATGAVTITNTIGYPFPSNATTTLLTFNTGGIIVNAASSTITNLVTVNATSTNATTTNLYASGQTRLASLSGLLLGSTGVVSAITTGTIGSTGVLGLSGGVPTYVATSTLYGAGGIPNTALLNSTISGIALGSNLNSHTHDGTLSGTSYNGSAAVSDWGLNLSSMNNWTQGLSIGSTTPWAALSIGTTTASSPTTALFAVGSSTLATLFSINGAGGITLSALQPATSTSMTLDWARTPGQVEYRIGASATTIILINATTSLQWGSRKLVTVCNPGSTASTISWQGVEWAGGTAPTQTTTANYCDTYSFFVTSATSSTAWKVFGVQSAGFQ